MIPNGAKAIAEVRSRGLKPAEMLIVSLIGRVNEQNHTIYAAGDKEYDWSWARGLQVCVYADSRSKWRPVLNAIATVNPAYLALWDAEKRQGAQVWRLPYASDIEKPKEQWRWKLDFLPWLPIQNQEFAWN